MKVAVSGKGGVGKSTLAAALALLLARRGDRVLAVDADPDANLARALGIPAAEQAAIIPIAEQVALIEERTGAKVNQYGQVFKLNPRVADIADTYAYNHQGVALLVLGAVQQGGGGCACPEGVLLRALVTDLILFKGDALVMDMEAGVEHLGRATARGVDTLLVVVEPGQRSVDTAQRIRRMAAEIGLTRLRFVLNKVVDAEDERFLRAALPGADIAGSIPHCDALRRSDRDGLSVLDAAPPDLLAAFNDLLTHVQEGADRG